MTVVVAMPVWAEPSQSHYGAKILFGLQAHPPRPALPTLLHAAISLL